MFAVKIRSEITSRKARKSALTAEEKRSKNPMEGYATAVKNGNRGKSFTRSESDLPANANPAFGSRRKYFARKCERSEPL